MATGTGERPLRVLRVYHSGVISSARERERDMRRRGVDVTLVSPRRWNEGGADVDLGDAEQWVIGARTIGRHPYLFVYDPIPIVRALLSNRFDIIDVHEEPASLAAAELVLLSLLGHRRTPMVMYGAQNLAKKYPWPFRLIERLSFRRIAAVYPCNSRAGEIFVERGLRRPVTVLPLGVDTTSVDVAAPPGPLDGPVTIGYVGRLAEHKGVHVLLAAVALLEPRFELRIVGDGPHRAALVALADRLGISDRVQFVGHRTPADINREYATVDIVAVPSQTRAHWVEQFGRVVVEAMAAGTPLVVSDSGSLPDVAGDAAVIVPEADERAWADALRDLAGDTAERTRLHRLGRDRAATFDWTEVARRQIDMYRELL